MPWLGRFYGFDVKTIEARAPTGAGIYVLWGAGRWIYVGATENLRTRLVALALGDDECISREAPTEFGIEQIDSPERRALRRAELIQELVPICP